MQQELELAVIPEKKDDPQEILSRGAGRLGVEMSRIKGFHVRKRSIDGRGKQVVYRMRVVFFVDEPPQIERYAFQGRSVRDLGLEHTVHIVGAGPAGLFAALRCIELGLKPVIFERGKDVKARRRDLAAINKFGLVNPDSNYCFGEGGAGTYSDGKLYTRSGKRGDIQKVLELFVAHGASDDILVNARPHIGTNKLPHIIEAIRETIIEHGGEVHFGAKLTDIETQFGAVTAVKLSEGTRIPCKHLILATGHSARDVFELVYSKTWLLESKPFALGVRIEHPQEIVDRAQYHCDIRSIHLPPAYYSLVEQVDGRGVFSFCMCPGGVIAPCATEPGEIVVNGWSPSKRNNPHANSGTVVQVALEDAFRVQGLGNFGKEPSPLLLLDLQRLIEKRAFEYGGAQGQIAPAQRMVDFVQNKLSATLPSNSYKPGARSVQLQEVLPDFVTKALRGALPHFGKKMKGYFTNEAILVGVESRTSSPVRIPRNPQTLQHPQVKGLYPCGEGAGYAGGIVSAAVDGMNCAEKILR